MEQTDSLIDSKAKHNISHGETFSGAFAQASSFSNCIRPLLKALKWHGRERELMEALPHFLSELERNSFCRMMEHLSFQYDQFTICLKDLDVRLTPCLFVSEDGTAKVILNRSNDRFKVFDGAQQKKFDLTSPEEYGEVIHFRHYDEMSTTITPELRKSWLQKQISDSRQSIIQILGISFLINLLGLGVPLFIMSIYDQVIPSGALGMLGEFFIGAAIAIVGILLLQLSRATLLAEAGNTLDRRIGRFIFERLLYLSPNYTEAATVGAQVARIKDFDNVRDFFTGPMMSLLFELPFVVIYILAIGWLGGNLFLIPLLMIAAFVLAALLLQGTMRIEIRRTAALNTKRQEFLLEALSNIRTLKYCSAEKTWLQRYKQVSANSALANFKATMLNASANIYCEFISIGSGTAVLAFGTIRVMENKMSVGALIATMILLWRVVSPVRSTFNSLVKIDQISNSVKQINNLMSIPPEHDPTAASKTIPTLSGAITFQNVGIRYSNELDPALAGINIKIAAGEIVGVTGHNGSGKSTLLKLIMSLYQPQTGTIYFDDIDIRQLDPVELRHAIAYVPQKTQLFFGTIEQNLRFANPTATEEELIEATKFAGIYEDIQALDDGLQTRVGNHSESLLPASFQQCLSLARAYLKHSPILLMDEPAANLDNAGDQLFINALKELRGHATVVFVTHRPSHLKNIDRILMLKGGRLTMDGPPSQVLPELMKEYQ